MEQAVALTLEAAKLGPVRLTPPPSKSDALRLLVLAHVLGRPEWVEALGPGPWASDIERLAAGLKALDASREGVTEIDAGDGAAPLRMLLALAGIRKGRFRFTGSPRLGERSHAALLSALEQSLGATGLIVKPGNPWPIEITATGATGAPHFRVPGRDSSQPASSLALAAGALVLREHRPWTIDIEGDLTSPGYLALTLHAMEQAGFEVRQTDGRITITSWDATRCGRPSVPADWSAAAFLLPIAWRTGGSVVGLDLTAVHPDRAVVGLLESVGLQVTVADETRVTGEPVCGLTVSGRDTPDLVPAMAALACVLPEPSVFSDLGTLRRKESDRLAGAIALATAAGAQVVVQGETVRIEPRGARPGMLGVLRPGMPGVLRLGAQNDHRMIMAAATLAVLLRARLELEGASGVEKSFPGFFEQLSG